MVILLAVGALLLTFSYLCKTEGFLTVPTTHCNRVQIHRSIVIHQFVHWFATPARSNTRQSDTFPRTQMTFSHPPCLYCVTVYANWEHAMRQQVARRSAMSILLTFVVLVLYACRCQMFYRKPINYLQWKSFYLQISIMLSVLLRGFHLPRFV